MKFKISFVGKNNRMPEAFKFKEFVIHQDKSAMKVGTDGVLLGAWCSQDFKPESILDIGSGTGVIALQLAQRFDAETIDAVEIDEEAYEQTVENFERSDWGDRLFCYHSNFKDFVDEFSDEEEMYELIVSNPPFYTDCFESDNDSRNKARFTTSLPFKELILGVSKLLSENGIFSVVIPFKEEKNFIELAMHFNLYITKRCRVKGTSNSDIKRSLLEFKKNQSEIIEESLTIEITRHQYTKKYTKLVKDFYLKF